MNLLNKYLMKLFKHLMKYLVICSSEFYGILNKYSLEEPRWLS